jgi:hypothetical protein
MIIRRLRVDPMMTTEQALSRITQMKQTLILTITLAIPLIMTKELAQK